MFTVVMLVGLWLSSQAGAPASPPQVTASPAHEELWEAARAGDAARVTRALDAGTDVNAKTRYGATALIYAADKGHAAVVTVLLNRGADVNAQDTFYRGRAIDMALGNKHLDVARLLLEKGSKGAAAALTAAAQAGDAALARAALASSEMSAGDVTAAVAAAKKANKPDVADLIAAKLASLPAVPTVTVDRATLQSYVGSYRSEALGLTIMAALDGEQLTLTVPGQPPLVLVARSPTEFTAAQASGLSFAFAGRGGMIERLLLTQPNGTQAFERVAAAPAPSAGGAAAGTTPAAPPATARPDASALKPAPRTAARPWPGFRGENASGNGDGQGAVAEWSVEKKLNIRWSTEIPGISNASPIVSGNRVFVVTAISSAGDKTFRTGLYGDVAPVQDVSEHTWKIYALDKASGRILWDRAAFTGLPKVKRHTKASQANSTPVTDGTRVVALFGSIGILAAWDMEGKPLWTTDVGILDSGWFFDPDYQWGHSSSPLIYSNTVIVQADRQKGSFLAAYSLDSGKQVWKTDRDEISTWGTPTLFRANGRDQIVTNGPKVRGYDAATGKLLWTLGPNSEVTVGTPVVGDGLVYVTGGYPPARPIYAVKPTATGDITLTKEQPTSDALAWTNDREGTYIPSPVYYDGLLYTLANQGILIAYDGKTGERIYRARVGGGGSFAASPIAADGRLYLANEDGEVYVVRAGRTYEELAKNEMKEVVMSTPAISDGVLVIRTLGRVYGIGQE